MSGLIWIQTVWHSDGIPERFFVKVNFLKKIHRQQKSMQNYPACKELTTCWCEKNQLNEWQTEWTLIRCCSLWHLVYVYTVCSGLLVQKLMVNWALTFVKAPALLTLQKPNITAADNILKHFFFFQREWGLTIKNIHMTATNVLWFWVIGLIFHRQ